MIFLKLLFYFMVCHSEGLPAVYFEAQPSLAEGQVVYLKDVAKFKNASAEQVEELSKIIVSGSASEYRSQSKHSLLQKMREQMDSVENDCDCRVQLIFPVGDDVVMQNVNGFSLDNVHQELANRLQKICTTCTYQIAKFNIMRGVIPEKFSHWEIQHDLRDLRGAVMLRVYFDNMALDPLILQTWIRIQRPVVVLKKSLSKGHLIKPDDYEVQIRDVTNEQRLFVDTKDLQGKELKRSLTSAQFVTAEDLTDRLSVRLGEPVAVEVQNGDIFIEMTGVAQKSGKLGERVPIRINKTLKQISAEVVGDSRVRL
jgi:flagella basal body P-ring formation protein FlgA